MVKVKKKYKWKDRVAHFQKIEQIKRMKQSWNNAIRKRGRQADIFTGSQWTPEQIKSIKLSSIS